MASDAAAAPTGSADGPAETSPPGGSGRSLEVTLSPANIWRVGFTVVGVIAIALFLSFVLDDGGSVIFTVLMSWFASLAMAPAVDRLARHMRRGVATMIVMISFILAVALFLLAFGNLLVQQIAEIIDSVPSLLESALAWVNTTFDMSLSVNDILNSLNLSPSQIAEIAAEVGVNVLGVLGSVLGAVFSIFTFGLFTFYLSADGPRFRRWVAALFPARIQAVVVNVWDLTAVKTGNYISARVVLAAINSATTGIVFLIIDMPYWLALALWTGIVAQFVPTIGTYIAIILPVIVGLLSDNPWVGVYALVWALLYQQVENLTIEPKISARAVNVNPAVSFGAVMLGAALFGVAGAFLAVPVAAMLLALLDIYAKRHELLPQLRDPEAASDLGESGTVIDESSVAAAEKAEG